MEREGIILPRAIYGNRGDLASRWALLRALDQQQNLGVHVFCDRDDDIPQLDFPHYPYGRMRNFLPDPAGMQAHRKARTVLWAVGLDMQDDSSLAKLVYLNLLFDRYRRMGLRVWCLFQGAGPITTPAGRWLSRRLLRKVDCFIARDPGSYALIRGLTEKGKCILGHDAIFLPGLENDLGSVEKEPSLRDLFETERPIIGLNIRQWYHFSSSLIPYQFAQKTYRERSLEKMERLENSAVDLIRKLRAQHDARIVLLSAYQPDVVRWEDDLFWLKRLKDMAQDDEVILADLPLSMPQYFTMMSGLDAMIGMRLHSTLIALRFGVPGINISYTLKGRDIMSHLGLGDWVIDLDDFVQSNEKACAAISTILSDREFYRSKTRTYVANAIRVNSDILENSLRAE